MNLRILRNFLTVALISKTIAQKKAALTAKRIATGVALFIASFVFAIIGGIGCIMSIFFALSHVSQFASASLITGGISFLVAILCTIEGIRFIKR